MNISRSLGLLLAVAALACGNVSAQTKVPKPFDSTKERIDGYLLSNDAYSKFFSERFSYALLGSQTPATGLKFETVKPSVTLSGNIFNSRDKRLILNLELTGGATDGFMELFSKNELSGYFKANLGLNWLRAKNSGWVKVGHELCGQSAKTKMNVLLLEIEAYKKSFYKAAAFQVVQDSRFLMGPTVDNFKVLMKEQIGRDLSPQMLVAIDLKALLGKYGLGVVADDEAALKAFAAQWVLDPASLADAATREEWLKNISAFAKDDLKAKKLFDSAETYIPELELKTFRESFGAASIKWWNLSPNFTNTSFKLLNPLDNSLIDENRSTFGAKLSYNYYLKSLLNKGKFFYVSGGLQVRRVNTLEELDKFNYKKSTVIKVNASESLSSEKTGLAYSGAFDAGAGLDVFLESYTIPWREAFIPGFYAKVQYTHGEPWLNKNKVSLDLGLLYNLTSSSKDAKNLLSVVPYVKWSNLAKERDLTDPSVYTALHDRFSVGVQVGIPINIGK